jgi:hypothetical protein
MFNVLISSNGTAWEAEGRLESDVGRFLEYSDPEARGISPKNPKSLRRLERITSLLLYENCVTKRSRSIVRIGQIHDIQVEGSFLTFRFAEAGRLKRRQFEKIRHRLHVSDFEMNRTHWAVKEGDVPQDVLALMTPTPKKYDVVLSFAGENRTYVEKVATWLEENGVVVFYDRFEEANLWGKDLAEYFDSIYRKQGRYCVLFASRFYADKLWTRHERRSALAAALEARGEYVLPARFDDTEIPGLRPAIAYQDLRKMTPDDLGKLILLKLGKA